MKRIAQNDSTSSSKTLKAVLFDANGVLYYRPRTRRFLAAFLKQHDLSLPSHDVIYAAQKQIRTANTAYHRTDLYDAVLHACGVSDPALYPAGRQALAEDAAAIMLYPSVNETLYTLRQRGFKLGVVTNSSATTTEKLQWLRAAGLDITWNAFVNSHDVGVRKPHARIYRLALDQCGSAAHEAMFVGHDANEIIGARTVGMITVAYGAGASKYADYMIQHVAELCDLAILQCSA
jgi:putative hydrolase of the HAD superfamily